MRQTNFSLCYNQDLITVHANFHICSQMFVSVDLRHDPMDLLTHPSKLNHVWKFWHIRETIFEFRMSHGVLRQVFRGILNHFRWLPGHMELWKLHDNFLPSSPYIAFYHSTPHDLRWRSVFKQPTNDGLLSIHYNYHEKNFQRRNKETNLFTCLIIFVTWRIFKKTWRQCDRRQWPLNAYTSCSSI